MDNGVQIRDAPTLLLGPCYVLLVCPLEDTIAGNVETLLLHILLHHAQNVPVVNAGGLEQSGEILNTEMPIGTSMGFAAPGRVFGQDTLTGKWGVSSPPPDAVTTDIPIRIPDVIPIFFVERVVRDELEGLPPKDETILQGQPYSFEEERVLQAAKMFQMAVLAQCHVEIAHAKGKMLS